MPTVGVVIIGDEILSGKFADENGPYLIRRLREIGADLMRLVTVPDVVSVIADEVARCASEFDLVITTGGVGPTHDDRTFEGIALGFDVPLREHPDLIALLFGFGLPNNEATLRMARVPLGAELVAGPTNHYPVLTMRNVHIFPGVPKLMQAKFETISERFAGVPVLTARLHTAQPETDIASVLTDVAQSEPQVAIGSYPRFTDGGHQVIITLESRDNEALARALGSLRSQIVVLA